MATAARSAIAAVVHFGWQSIFQSSGATDRPVPRLVDSLEMLLNILHPQQGQPSYQGEEWQNLANPGGDGFLPDPQMPGDRLLV